jgi:hypothetical protein
MNMSMISTTAIPAVATRSADFSFKTVLLLCCAGLAVSFSLMAHGIDLSAGLI